MFHHVGALFDAIVDLIGLRFLARHNRTDIFYKIYAALFTRAALTLFVFASGTFKTERSVAPRTKSRNFARISRTLGAFDHALRTRRSVKGRSASNSRAGWRPGSSVRGGRRSYARLRSRGSRRNSCGFRRCIAMLTGRKSPTHAYSLAEYRTRKLCGAENVLFGVNCPCVQGGRISKGEAYPPQRTRMPLLL
jgi:hypothetical protein